MFTLLAELKVQPGKVEEAKAAFRDLQRAVKASEPGTLTYTFHQRRDDPATFIVYERYQDEAAFQTHMANLGQHAGTFGTLLESGPNPTFLVDI